MAPKVTEEHKEQRRRDIMDAAINVFKRKGYEPTTMQDIIEESGMSRGGVYLYFSNKENLYYTIIDEILDKSFSSLDDIIENNDTVWSAVEQILREIAEGNKKVKESLAPVSFEYFISGWRNEERTSLVKARYLKVIRLNSGFFQKGVTSKEFSPLLPLDTIVKFMIAFMDGLTLHSLPLDDEIDIDGQVEAFRIFLRHILQVKDS